MIDFTAHTIDTAPEESRATMEEVKSAFGRVSGLIAVMAEAPALAKSYWQLHHTFMTETTFDKDELTVIWQTINVEHECHYCVPGHTGIAKKMKVDDAITNALRDETPLPTAHLEALRTFTLQIVRQRGNVTQDQMQTFLDAGYTKRQILEVLVGTAQKVMSNYTNAIAQTPVDPAMQAFAWEKATPALV
ncbi:carboxymuconolactone decarboxylase family protein [Celeribacter sp. PS-C1]|uniref:carboxymuconolactone decarboxylase family protein n=1 Tax=Celeribacter sp. PS-C1 TaxID=2820813 RepID=UPI001CA54007|nr:carboxymuconolactone decarboxylase family protein [Celeribacter sp. PS-C1]MBW6419719.1 carboxymuconolactone decarboxylase family protein [Celeribacter sp. PS-C1]